MLFGEVVVYTVFLTLLGRSRADEQGRFSAVIHQGTKSAFARTMYEGTEIKIRFEMIACANESVMTLKWLVKSTSCYGEYLYITDDQHRLNLLMESPFLQFPHGGDGVLQKNMDEGEAIRCGNSWSLENLSHRNWTAYPIHGADDAGKREMTPVAENVKRDTSEANIDQLLTVTPAISPYVVIVAIESDSNFSCEIEIDTKGPNGYLSPLDYPLYMFYLATSALYFLYTVAWIVMSVRKSRGLVSLHHLIGIMIVLSLAESFAFYMRYLALNSTGDDSTARIISELISITKRSFARALVIAIGLGIGTARPRRRLTTCLLITAGCFYFIFAGLEVIIRTRSSGSVGNKWLLVSIIQAALDLVYCMWVFVASIQTMKFFKLHNNAAELTLYKRFVIVLFLGVVCSILFAVCDIGRRDQCFGNWPTFWLGEAFWLVIFFIILTFIIVSWRPKSSQQTYSFSHLTEDDNADDGDDCKIEESST